MLDDILKWILLALSIPVLVLLIAHTGRRMKALSKRIDQYHEEQEQAKSKPGPINPYADMAGAFGAKPDKEQTGKTDGSAD